MQLPDVIPPAICRVDALLQCTIKSQHPSKAVAEVFRKFLACMNIVTDAWCLWAALAIRTTTNPKCCAHDTAHFIICCHSSASPGGACISKARVLVSAEFISTSAGLRASESALATSRSLLLAQALALTQTQRAQRVRSGFGLVARPVCRCKLCKCGLTDELTVGVAAPFAVRVPRLQGGLLPASRAASPRATGWLCPFVCLCSCYASSSALDVRCLILSGSRYFAACRLAPGKRCSALASVALYMHSPLCAKLPWP